MSCPLVARLISEYLRICWWFCALPLLVVIIGVVTSKNPPVVYLAFALIVVFPIVFTVLIVNLIWFHEREPELFGGCCHDGGGVGDDGAEEEGDPRKPRGGVLLGRISLVFSQMNPKGDDGEQGAQTTQREGHRVDLRDPYKGSVEKVV